MWESKLWSYLSQGDGIHCPAYFSCQTRLSGCVCLSDHDDYCSQINMFIDNDSPEHPGLQKIETKFYPANCHTQGRIFHLVYRLANRYTESAGIDHPPVPSDLITQTSSHLPIEIRRVPLKVHHGAVWKLSDGWVVHLNSTDTPARQRFTLYHEIFHILAHCQGTPVFKKSAYTREGFFNEMLADHFAAVILVPTKLVKKIWPEVKDIKKMADLFEVPETIILVALRQLCMI